MSLNNTDWIEEFIAGLESVGIELSEERKEKMKSRGVERMKEAFGGDSDD